MQLFRQIDTQSAALVGWGVRVMLVSPEADQTAARIAGFGGLVETEADLFAAVEAMHSDTTGYGVFLMDCDAYGGLEAGRRAVALLGRAAEQAKVILLSREVQQQVFPEDGGRPILLRAPVSAVSLRVGFEHALRDRLVYLAA